MLKSEEVHRLFQQSKTVMTHFIHPMNQFHFTVCKCNNPKCENSYSICLRCCMQTAYVIIILFRSIQNKKQDLVVISLKLKQNPGRSSCNTSVIFL